MKNFPVNNFTAMDSIYGKFFVNRHCSYQADALIKTGIPHIQEELDKILQAYSVAELRHQAQLEGYIVTETKLDNGDIELVAEVYN